MDIGGQAVIEGVMIRSPKHVSVAVRDPKGKPVIKAYRFKSLGEKHKFFKLPFVRGVVSMYEMLRVGLKELVYSGNISSDEEEDLSDFAVTVTIGISLLFAVGLFVALPYILASFFGFAEEESPVLFNLIDGAIKIAILIGYIYAISLMDDIKRVFQYHGAEHKAVNCFEHGEKVTVKNAAKYTTIHKRCGTSFIVFVFLVMLLLFSVVPSLIEFFLPQVSSLSFIWRRVVYFSARLLLLAPVISISYEVLKITSKYDNFIVNLLAVPGRMIQGLTTKEPDKKQLEIAVLAVNSALDKEASL